MTRPTRRLIPLADRGPLRVMFVNTSLHVGGAETLLVNLIRRLDRRAFAPEVCCLKTLGPLGEELALEIPAWQGFVGSSKFDPRVLTRLTRLFRQRRIDAVVTVGAGDKMFWGRLAAYRAGVPVVLSAIHSTGWPDGIGFLNRRLTSITDGFIGVATEHGRHLVEQEGFPGSKVHVITNGVDTERFTPELSGDGVRKQLGIDPQAPVVGIVAALRPEKNHDLFLEIAALTRATAPEAKFLIVGDGAERERLETLARDKGLSDRVLFLGTRADIPELLAAMDIFLLTSRNEANPVSILEAMASGKPVVAPRVGSIADVVAEGETGYLTPPGEASVAAARVSELIADPARAKSFGQRGRQVVREHWSLERMVGGYERLIASIYDMKAAPPASAPLGERAVGAQGAGKSA